MYPVHTLLMFSLFDVATYLHICTELVSAGTVTSIYNWIYDNNNAQSKDQFVSAVHKGWQKYPSV